MTDQVTLTLAPPPDPDSDPGPDPDQDEDGSHIKGLLISMLHRFWPELLEQRYLQA